MDDRWKSGTAAPRGGLLRRVFVPAPQDDPRRDLALRMLNLIGWALIATVAAALPALLAVLPEYAVRWMSMVALQVAIGAGAIVLARRGRLRTAALFIVVALWALGTYSVVSTGGVWAPTLVGMVVFSAVASLVIGWRSGMVAVAASVATILVVAGTEAADLLPQPVVVHTLWSRAVTAAVYTALAGVLVAVATMNMARARDEAERELEERRAAEQALRERNAELDALLRAGRAVVSSLDYDRVLFEVARTAGDALGSPECVIWEFDPARHRMVFRSLWQLVPVPGVVERLRGTSFDAGEVSLGLDSLLTGEVLQASAGDARLSERDQTSLGKWGNTSSMRVPLVSERGLQGVMYLLESGRERTFTEQEMRLARAIGEQAAVALDNARLYTERREAERELSRLNADLERRVELRTAQLRAANEEMEAFAYSVSHDLRGPLRAIDGFSAVVLQDASDRLDLEERESLERVRAAAQRMDQLIDALLSLSRLSRKKPDVAVVDLSALAAVVVERLREQEPGRGVDVVIAPACTVVTDADLLEVVLTNLIGNAWKFTGRRERAHIEVGVTQAAADRVFFVRDDGAGFEAAYAGQLFQPFHRLHGTDEFPGTGIGLATVRRIVTRLGGVCWAEGAQGEGATFSFTLPELVT